MNFLTNTGMYVVDPRVVEELEEDTFIGFPDIMERYRLAGEKVGVYPVSENSWMDMGQMEELEQMRRENEEGVTFEGKHYTLYEASQQQRKMERRIRKQKRRILVDEATGDKDKLQNDQIRLQVQKQNYARFSKGVGLPTQHARMETAGFNWKHGKAAERHHSVAEYIGRSVGAKAKNYQVLNPQTGAFVQLVEGSRITQPKNHIMAGKGRERQIDCIDWLVDKYGGDAVQWTKEKGFGFVADDYGEPRMVELHWYQEPTVGKVEMKIKDRDGRIYIDDE